MKRYVQEMINDFYRDYKEKCKENPTLLPSGFRDAVYRKVELPYKYGGATERDAVKKLLEIWDSLDDWIWKHMGEYAIKL